MIGKAGNFLYLQYRTCPVCVWLPFAFGSGAPRIPPEFRLIGKAGDLSVASCPVSVLAVAHPYYLNDKIRRENIINHPILTDT